MPFDTDDMILPEGFDPSLGDQNFTEDGELAVAVTPTTENNPTTDIDNPVEQTVVKEEGNTSPVVEEPVIPQQKVRVKYNHEERDLSLDEAAIYAQKGMNYDRIEQRSKEQEAKLNRFEQQAKLFGYENADAMMKQAEQNFVDIKIRDLMEQGNSEAMARFLVNQEMKELKAAKEEPTEDTPVPEEKPAEPAKPGLSEDKKAELREFSEAYPGVIKIPDEVFRMYQKGTKLKDAYAIWEKNEQLKKANTENNSAMSELAILRQNQASAARAPVAGTVGQVAPASQQADDPFLIGFNSDY